MRDTGTPIWVGEFGPVYTGDQDRDAVRYQVLRDQLEIYDRYDANWTIWTYKDIGLQGLVYTAPDSPWRARIRPLLDKKARLGTDAWGTVDTDIRHVLQPLEDLLAKEYPHYDPFPFGRQWMVNRLVRHILLAEPMAQELAEAFLGLDAAGIDELMGSFAFDRCVRRKGLEGLLRAPSRTGER